MKITESNNGSFFAYQGIMSFGARLLLTLPLLACACVQDSVGVFDSSDSADEQDIRYVVPEQATTLVFTDFSTTADFTLAYGQCELGTPSDGVDIQVNCGDKWSDVAWLSVSRKSVHDMLVAGKTTLSLSVASLNASLEDDNLRISFHQVDAEGNKTKVLSEPSVVLDGTASVELVDGISYSIYLARGEHNSLLWDSGTIETSLALESN